ncbi:AI-2E family transporter [Tomitella biformata]|uniref:AI-2E family transporter n=1 Tax=Tomitella biformata TaxID=630403 RepID=UPI0004B3C269|nr:AI-2E family transporter [Tomitella biformata]
MHQIPEDISGPVRRARGEVIGAGGRWLSEWSLRLILIVGAIWVLDIVVSKAWVVVLPILLAIVLSTVLWPIAGWMQRKRVPPALAAGLTMIGFLAVLAGVIAAIAPSVVNQSSELANKAVEGLHKVQEWITGPPLNVHPEQIDQAIQSLTGKLQSSATMVASGVFSGVSTAGSMIVTILLVLVLVFFFIKDGPRFLPWLRQTTGSPAARHFETVASRMWETLGGFIRTQAQVALIDAVFIGAGLFFLGVPLAGALAVITFFAAFIPIVGAFVAGGLAVLIALVGNGLTTALFVLLLIFVVQQVEGNVLSPMMQSKSMNLHPAIVLLAVAGGGSLWGIVGAFLAVPLAAVIAVLFRYLDEQIAERSADVLLSEAGDHPSEAILAEAAQLRDEAHHSDADDSGDERPDSASVITKLAFWRR